jgi:hypothetical protein
MPTTSNPATLRDPALQAAFERDGYVRIPLLPPEDVDALRRLYTELGPAPDDPRRGCINTLQTADVTYRTAVHDGITPVLVPHLEATFDRQTPLLAQFLIKWPGEGGDMPMHQDTNLVDERTHRSCEVWVALDDVDERNGQMWMVPGSHTWMPTFRGISSWFRPPFEGVEARIRSRHAIAVPVRAGDAVVFDHAVLHFSLPNRTAAERRVVITDLVPEGAPQVHYVARPDGSVDGFEVDPSFWLDFDLANAGRPPQAPRSRTTVDVTFAPVDDARLDELVARGQAVDRLADDLQA